MRWAGRLAVMARLLLSAFDAFGTHTTNLSSVVARRIWEEGIDGVDLAAIELPTIRGVASSRLIDAFGQTRPDVVVMLGIADKRDEITPERIAINVDDYRIADNAGNQPVDEPVVAGGPAAYLATLPIKRIVARLREADIPSSVSNSAGTFLCNHVSYSMLHHVERTGIPCRAGFIHIPADMPLALAVLGVRLAIEVTLEPDTVVAL